MCLVLPIFHLSSCVFVFFFFFNDTATTEIYTYGHSLSLHDALPISRAVARAFFRAALVADRRARLCAGGRLVQPLRRLVAAAGLGAGDRRSADGGDRKSTRLNSSH